MMDAISPLATVVEQQLLLFVRILKNKPAMLLWFMCHLCRSTVLGCLTSLVYLISLLLIQISSVSSGGNRVCRMGRKNVAHPAMYRRALTEILQDPSLRTIGLC